MTTAADICRYVIDEGNPLIDAVFDHVGVGERAGNALVNKLCHDGVLKRDGERLRVQGSGQAARKVAEQGAHKPAVRALAGSLGKGEPRVPVKTPRAQRRELPVPASFEVRKDVPCPPKGRGPAKREIPWPFAALAPGDSFVYRVPEGWTADEVADQFRKDAYAYRKSAPTFRFAVRILTGGEFVGFWREADLGYRVPA